MVRMIPRVGAVAQLPGPWECHLLHMSIRYSRDATVTPKAVLQWNMDTPCHSRCDQLMPLSCNAMPCYARPCKAPKHQHSQMESSPLSVGTGGHAPTHTRRTVHMPEWACAA